jgi:hypothetical protein
MMAISFEKFFNNQSGYQTGDNVSVGRSEKKMPVVASSKSGAGAGDTSLIGAIMEPTFIPDATLTAGVSNGQQPAFSVGGQLGQATGERAQVQHTVHDLEPLTTYSMRVIAVNAIGQSRPSVALSLRTEEEGKLAIGLFVCVFFAGQPASCCAAVGVEPNKAHAWL